MGSPSPNPFMQVMGVLFEAMKQPVISGYLVGGAVVGPGGLQLVKVGGSGAWMDGSTGRDHIKACRAQHTTVPQTAPDTPSLITHCHTGTPQSSGALSVSFCIPPWNHPALPMLLWYTSKGFVCCPSCRTPTHRSWSRWSPWPNWVSCCCCLAWAWSSA